MLFLKSIKATTTDSRNLEESNLALKSKRCRLAVATSSQIDLKSVKVLTISYRQTDIRRPGTFQKLLAKQKTRLESRVFLY